MSFNGLSSIWRWPLVYTIQGLPGFSTRAVSYKLPSLVDFDTLSPQNSIAFFIRHKTAFEQVFFEPVDRVIRLPLFKLGPGHVPGIVVFGMPFHTHGLGFDQGRT